MAEKKTLSKADLEAKIRELVGAERAEMREEAVAKSQEKSRDERRHVISVIHEAAEPARAKSQDIGNMDPEEMTAQQKNQMVGRCVRYMAIARGDVFRATEIAAKSGDKILAERWEKALGTGTLAGGGALIPPEFSQDFIEELGAKAVVVSMGVDRVPMAENNLTLPFLDSSATAAYKAESANATKSEPTFGQLSLNTKELIAIVPYSNQLLASPGAKIEMRLRDHLLRVMARKMDVTLIRSAGSSSEPKGMLYWADSGNKFNSSGTTLAQTTDDLGDAVQKLEDNDVPLDGAPGWLFNPRTKKHLMTIRDSNGNYAFRDELNEGKLMGYPFKVTTQIPKNLGGGSNESEVYFAAFDSLILGEQEDITLSAHPDAAYWDGSSVVSGLSRNETVMRAVAHHDFGAGHRGKEIAVIQAVTWGA